MDNKTNKQLFLIRIAREYPLATVMILAIIFRLLAVIFSKGYLYTDDHYETISVAYKWLQDGLFNAEGYLTWGDKVDSSTIARCPLYTLFLYGIMKIQFFFGIESLNNLMYSVRAVHGLISLISVYTIYKIVELVTKSTQWAMIGGLLLALHFAVPSLSVRTLIEFFNGHFWFFAIYLIYLYHYKKGSVAWLFWAGIIAGLAWMIRFQIAFAIIVTPIILIWEYRRIKEAVWFSIGALTMVAIAGWLDYMVLDSFLAGTINHIKQALRETDPAVEEPFWVYVAVLTFLFIPPLSIVTFILAGFKKFWTNHKVLIFSTLSFIIIHTYLWNRQERFMMPIIPIIILIMTLVIWQQFSEKRFLFKYKRLFIGMVIFSIALNLFLLPIFTMNYGRKGLVEPFVRIEKLTENPTIILFSPDKFHQMYPCDYTGYKGRTRYNITNWESFDTHFKIHNLNSIESYYILYPQKEGDLQKYIDSLETRLDNFEQLYHVGPSTIDYTLHLLNPRHNRTFEAWVYKHNAVIE